MIETLKNAWRIDELRKKILFTLFIILIYRIGNAIPVPYVDTALLKSYFTQLQNTMLGLWNTMSGGSFSSATIFALSIQPYINASIIIQLLTVAIPALERMQKEGGEEGKKKLAAITRYSTVAIGLLQGWAYYMLISRNSLLTADGTGVWPAIVIIMTFMAGSALIMWLGEQITEFGVGNGISIILFSSIVSRFPSDIYAMITSVGLWSDIKNGVVTLQGLLDGGYTQEAAEAYMNGAMSPWMLALMLIGSLLIIVLIVIVNDAERRIPVQYSKRVVGRKMYGGQSTHLPMKVNMSGVLPVIFAQSFASIPGTICVFVPSWQNSWVMLNMFNNNTLFYAILYLLLIIFFAYFYSTVQFNPVEVANNLRKNGGFIPGIRPGKPTSEYVQKVLNKITLFGALYLAVVAVSPVLVGVFSKSSMNISLSGTSVIIVVGVAIETVRSIEAQMLMRNYKGFLD